MQYCCEWVGLGLALGSGLSVLVLSDLIQGLVRVLFACFFVRFHQLFVYYNRLYVKGVLCVPSWLGTPRKRAWVHIIL